MNKKNVVIIGCGMMGKLHISKYENMKNVCISGICDEKNIPELKNKYLFLSNIKQLFTLSNINYISICTPATTHYNIIKESIRKGIKNIFVEKPLCNNSADAKNILKLVKKKKINIFVGHIERYNIAIETLKKVLRAKTLGKIKTIIFRRVGPHPPKHMDVDVTMDSTIHDIDILLYLFGYSIKFKKLAFLEKNFSDILLKYKGINCFFQTNWLTPLKIRSISITGTEGYAEVDYIKQELKINGKVVCEKNYDLLEKELTDFVSDKKPKISINEAIKAIEFVEKIKK